MTTQIKRFIQLSEKFAIIYDNDGNDSIQYIINNQTEKAYDEQGEKLICDYCNKQLFYDGFDLECRNDNCNREYIHGNRVNVEE